MPRIAYEPTIDGLRAVAVLAVLLYHLAPACLPGGFTGVDIFFVISGFLITRIITTELDAGSFSLARFYQRRIARILPPLVTMAVATLVAAFLVYSCQDLASAGANFGATLLSIVNMKLMFQGNYFEMSPDAQPFLHCWSLAVEEQFYLLFPMMLALLYRVSGRWTARVGVLVFAASLVFCTWLSWVRPQWAFYLLPARAWELLAGALVSRLPTRAINSQWRSLAGSGGMMLLIAALAAMPSGQLFPGPLALWPVVGVIGVLVATTGDTRSWLAALLSAPVMRAVGALSYSLYLWHWPIFSFVDYAMLMHSEPVRLVIKIVLCIFAAVASYRWVEIPARAWFGQPRHAAAAFVFLALCMAVGPAVGGWIRSQNYLNASPRELAAGGIRVNPNGTKGSVMLIGDSIGSMYGTALRQACEIEGRKLSVLSVAGGNPLIAAPDEDNRQWRVTLGAIEKMRPDVVVIGAAWDPRIGEQAGFPALVIDAIRPHVAKIVLINAVPELPAGASRAAIRAGARPPFYEPAESFRRRSEANRLLVSHADEMIQVIDASRFFSLPGYEVAVLDGEGRCLYQDRGHVSGWGADQLIQEFRNTLVGVAAREQ